MLLSASDANFTGSLYSLFPSQQLTAQPTTHPQEQPERPHLPFLHLQCWPEHLPHPLVLLEDGSPDSGLLDSGLLDSGLLDSGLLDSGLL